MAAISSSQDPRVLPSVSSCCKPQVYGAVTDEWVDDVAQRSTIVRRMADEFSARFVPFQAAFDKALELEPLEHWTTDGVHPTPAGHQLLSDTWLKAVRE